MRIRRLFLKARDILIKFRMIYLKVLGMDIASSAKISLSAKIDITYPKGIHIGKNTYVGGAVYYCLMILLGKCIVIPI